MSFLGDIALSSAGFVLLSSDLRSLITLRDLSSRIINRIKFNFVGSFNFDCLLWCSAYILQAWAIVYNMIGVPVAAGVIYPAGHVRLSPVWASLAMALSWVLSYTLRLYSLNLFLKVGLCGLQLSSTVFRPISFAVSLHSHPVPCRRFYKEPARSS